MPTGGTSRPVFAAALIAALLVGLFGGYLAAGVTGGGLNTVTVTREVARTVELRTTLTERLLQTVTRTETQLVEKREPEVQYARFFSIERGEGYTLLRDGLNRTVLLVKRGQSAPQNVKADLVVQVPVERMVLMSATHVALVERLREYAPNIWDGVAGIMWGRSYQWFFPEVERRFAEGKLVDVGAAWSPDYEKLIALKPDLVMIYTFEGDPVRSKLEELKVPYVVNSEWLENTLLGRFEWIKFVAAFFGLDEVGVRVFRLVEFRYQLISTKVSASMATLNVKPVKVAWFSVYRGTVFVAGGLSYVANSIYDLNAVYAFSDLKATGGRQVSLEELVARARDADVLVISTDLIQTLEALTNEIPQVAEFKAVREGRVYRFNSNIYQLGYMDTEGWFLDLASMLYSQLFPDHTPSYFVAL
jgi:iron complex transport system substrate-binding protein